MVIMSHDELLAKIDHHMLDIVQTQFNDYKAHKALRAVVELHKPYAGSLNDVPTFRCAECGFACPCPTIKAIEKELF
jgi:hypothetical protein